MIVGTLDLNTGISNSAMMTVTILPPCTDAVITTTPIANYTY
jgi:hypothetical protein